MFNLQDNTDRKKTKTKKDSLGAKIDILFERISITLSYPVSLQWATQRATATHRYYIKSHLVASLTIISNYINTINMVRLLSVELDSE